MFAKRKPYKPKPPAKSKRFSLTGSDLSKVARGAFIAGLGGLAAYFTTQIPQVDLSTSEGIILAIAYSILANFIRKFLSNSPGGTQ